MPCLLLEDGHPQIVCLPPRKQGTEAGPGGRDQRPRIPGRGLRVVVEHRNCIRRPRECASQDEAGAPARVTHRARASRYVRLQAGVAAGWPCHTLPPPPVPRLGRRTGAAAPPTHNTKRASPESPAACARPSPHPFSFTQCQGHGRKRPQRGCQRPGHPVLRDGLGELRDAVRVRATPTVLGSAAGVAGSDRGRLGAATGQTGVAVRTPASRFSGAEGISMRTVSPSGGPVGHVRRVSPGCCTARGPRLKGESVPGHSWPRTGLRCRGGLRCPAGGSTSRCALSAWWNRP